MSALAGKPVMLHFTMKKAELFSFVQKTAGHIAEFPEIFGSRYFSSSFSRCIDACAILTVSKHKDDAQESRDEIYYYA